MDYLEHLDERDAEVQIRRIAANKAEAVEDTNWQDCTKVHSASHLDCFAAIEETSCPSQDLGHEGRNNKMPAC